MSEWRGLVQLVEEAVVAAAGALERAQKETAAVPFLVLEAVPVLQVPARAVHEVHDAAVSLVYAAVRVGGQTVGRLLDEALVMVETRAARANR
jgi:hypothetical protein